MIPARYIGVGVGSVIGAWTQDPFDNPFSGILGATIGGVVGSHISQNVDNDFNKFVQKTISKKNLYATMKGQSFLEADRARVMDTILDAGAIKKLPGAAQTQYMEALRVNMNLTDVPKYEAYTAETIDLVMDKAREKAQLRSFKDLRSFEKGTRGFRSGLASSNIAENNIPKAMTLGSSFKDRVRILTDILNTNGLDSASNTARGLATILQGQEIAIEYTSKGLASGIKVKSLGETIPLAKTINYGGQNIRAIGMMEGTLDELFSGRNIGITSLINADAGNLGSKSGLNDPLITIEHASKGYTIEEFLAQASDRSGGKGVSSSELSEMIRYAKSHVNYSASHSIDSMLQTSATVDVSKRFSIQDNKLTLANTDRNVYEDGILRGIFDARGTDPLEGLSHNTTFAFNAGTFGFTPLDPFAQRQYGAGLTNVREAKAFAPSPLLDAFTDEFDYIKRNSQAAGRLYIDDDLNKFISKKYGADLFVSDGSSIMLNMYQDRNGKVVNMAENVTQRTITLGLDSNKSWHNFVDLKTGVNLIDDKFLALDAKSQQDILRKYNKLTWRKDAKIGLGTDSEMERVPKYADFMNIKRIIKTDNGLEILADLHAGTEGTFQKIFAQGDKAGSNKANARSFEIRKLSLAVSSGEVELRGEELFMKGSQEPIALQKLMRSGNKRLNRLWKNYAGLGILTTFGQAKMEGIQGLLSADNKVVEKAILSARSGLINPAKNTFKDSPYLMELANRFGGVDAEGKAISGPENASIYRFFDMLQAENRQRAATLESISMNNYKKGNGITPQILRTHMELMKDSEDSQKFIFEQIKNTFGYKAEDTLRAKYGNIVFGLETGIAIHGAGNKSTSSWLQTGVMKDLGFTDNLINDLYDSNINALKDLTYIATSAEDSGIGKGISADNLKKLAGFTKSAPEERAAQLSTIGINAGDASAVPYQLFTENELGYKSIPIVLDPTNRSNMNMFGKGTTNTLSAIEAARAKVIQSDIDYRITGNELDRRKVLDSLGLLHDVNKSSVMELRKEAAKRTSKDGSFMIARYAGGEVMEAQQALLAQDKGNTAIFINEATARDIEAKAHARGGEIVYQDVPGTKYTDKDAREIAKLEKSRASRVAQRSAIGNIDDTKKLSARREVGALIAEIDERLRILKARPKAMQVMQMKLNGNLYDLTDVMTREPAQGPFSTVAAKVVVGRNLPGKANQEFWISEGLHNERTKKAQENILSILQKLDTDADTPAHTFSTGATEESMKELQGLMKTYREKSVQYAPLMEALDPKKDKPDKTGFLRSVFGIDNVEEYKMRAQMLGSERKYSAGSVTKINQEVREALGESAISFNDKMLAKSVAYQFTESLLKTSHKAVGDDTHAAIELMNKVINDVRTRTTHVNSDKATFINEMSGSMDSIFANPLKTLTEKAVNKGTMEGDQAASILGDYQRGKSLMLDAYYGKLTKPDKIETMAPIMAFSFGKKKTAGDLKNLIMNLYQDPTQGLTSEAAQNGLEIEVRNATSNLGETAARSLPGVKQLWKKNKMPLMLGLAGLAGLAVINGADATEVPARNIPSANKRDPNQQLEPRSTEVGYNRKLRDNYDVRVTTRGNNKQNITEFIKGDGKQISKVDVNYKTRQS